MNSIDREIDEIYDNVDDLFRAEKFNKVSLILKKVDVKEADTDILLAYLTITLSAKSLVTYRSKFYDYVEKEIISREGREYTSNLLKGLS